MHINKTEHLCLHEYSSFVILDGGLATQLEAQGCDLNSSLWSARLLHDDPRSIIDAHIAYLNAGAQIITTASYQASISGFMSLGLTDNQATDLILDSVRLAKTAVTEFMQANQRSTSPQVAASVGPYGAVLADGSEYKGQYGISDTELTAFHASRLKLLDQSDADILACETIPSFQEAKVLAELLEHVQTPAWVSFSCKDGLHINDGTPVNKVAKLFTEHPKVIAVGVNCTAIEHISQNIKEIKNCLPDKLIVVYPNSGEHYDAITKSWITDKSTIKLADKAIEWYRLGANIIGGCCRIGPEQISELETVLTGVD